MGEKASHRFRPVAGAEAHQLAGGFASQWSYMATAWDDLAKR